MQLLLNIEELNPEIENLAIPLTEKKVKERLDLRQEDTVTCVNIGPGADVLVILASIWTIGLAIWEFPTVLREGLKNWKWLIDKIKGFVKKNQLVSVDMDGAFLLVIDYLSNEYGDESNFSMMDAHTFKIVDISGMYPNNEDSLPAHPHNYYVFVIWIADRKLILSVRSNGEIRVLESFDDMPYGIYDKI